MEQITDGSYHSSDHEEGAREEKEEDVRTSKVHVSDCKYVFVFAVLDRVSRIFLFFFE